VLEKEFGHCANPSRSVERACGRRRHRQAAGESSPSAFQTPALATRLLHPANYEPASTPPMLTQPLHPDHGDYFGSRPPDHRKRCGPARSAGGIIAAVVPDPVVALKPLQAFGPRIRLAWSLGYGRCRRWWSCLVFHQCLGPRRKTLCSLFLPPRGNAVMIPPRLGVGPAQQTSPPRIAVIAAEVFA